MTEKGQKKVLRDLLKELSTPVLKAGKIFFIPNLFCSLFASLRSFISILQSHIFFVHYAPTKKKHFIVELVAKVPKCIFKISQKNKEQG